jgi:hypothetical protein
MILHIFKKDVRLLWRMAIAVALINAIRVTFTLSHRLEMGLTVERWGGLFIVLGVVAPAFLILMAVHRDPLPGLRSDWLVRPIARRDLLLSKLLFAAVIVRLPVFLIDFTEGLIAGFPASQALSLALGRAFWIFISVDIVVLAFASLTRNLTEAIGAAIGVFAVGTLCDLALPSGNAGGTWWISNTLQTAWLLAGAASVLALQYYRRKTLASRWFLAAALITAVLISSLFPAQQAFAIQERFSSDPDAARPIQIAYNPRPNDKISSFSDFRRTGNTILRIPLRGENEGTGQVLNQDGIRARLTEPDGRTTELEGTNQYEGGGGFADLYPTISVPPNLLTRMKAHPVRLDLDLSLTLLQPDTPATTFGQNDLKYSPWLGWCATRRTLALFALRCAVPGRAPCTIMSAQNTETGKPIGESHGCFITNYAPSFENIDRDIVGEFQMNLDLGATATNWTRHPDTEADLSNARILVQTFHPVAHFTRHVTIPGFRLPPQ